MANNRRNFLEGSRNPFLKESALAASAGAKKTLDGSFIQRSSGTMTVQGAVNKSLLLGMILVVGAYLGFTTLAGNPIFIWGGAILGFILVLIMSFRPTTSPYLGPVYAFVEGIFVGGVSAMYSGVLGMSGIIFQAVTLTLTVLFLMLVVYKAGLIKVNQKFRSGMMIAIGSIALFYIVTLVLGFFGVNTSMFFDGGLLSIGISLVIVGVASLSLLLDFDTFYKGEEYGAPIYMEWFAAVGLLVTLVWLYLEILRLLALLNSND